MPRASLVVKRIIASSHSPLLAHARPRLARDLKRSGASMLPEIDPDAAHVDLGDSDEGTEVRGNVAEEVEEERDGSCGSSSMSYHGMIGGGLEDERSEPKVALEDERRGVYAGIRGITGMRGSR